MPGDARGVAIVEAQARGTVSGLAPALAIARTAGLEATARVADGDRVRAGTRVLELRGNARAILGVERALLNVLMHLSGVATATERAVRAVGPDGPEVWGTRKTLPGLRDLEKAAVVHGGGRPHRRDLAEALLVKSNHLAFVPLAEAVRKGRAAAGTRRFQVEVRTFAEAREAVRAGARSLLIDNATPTRARRIVAGLAKEGLRTGVHLELSGGVTPRTIRRYRSTGVDAVSVGALTHSAVALPFHLTVRPATR